MRIVPLNTEYNRIASIYESGGSVVVDFVKAGIIYFKWQPNGGDTIMIKCEQGFFEKNFRCYSKLEETKEIMSIDQKKMYADYPHTFTKNKY